MANSDLTDELISWIQRQPDINDKQLTTIVDLIRNGQSIESDDIIIETKLTSLNLLKSLYKLKICIERSHISSAEQHGEELSTILYLCGSLLMSLIPHL